MATTTKLILKHTSGSKSGHVEEFEIDDRLEVALGRDESSDVQFGDSDDLVSRNHARLTATAGEPPTIELTDLGSSNGTFLNKQRLSGSATVKAGDAVQLGAGGPEIEIDLDPRPEGAKATRLATPAAAATRMAAEAPAKSGVGKATVERMLTDTKQKSKKQMLTFAAIGLAVVAVVVLVMIFQGRSLREKVEQTGADAQNAVDQIQAGAPLTPKVIASANEAAVVRIELLWRLVESRTGEQIYHRYSRGLPAYVLVQTANGPSIEPWLWDSSEGGTNVPVVGMGHGSGFVVTEDGFILTNRHVASGWDYSWDPIKSSFPGRLFNADLQEIGELEMGQNGPYVKNYQGAQQIPFSLLSRIFNWIPSRAYSPDGQAVKGRMTGRLDRLDVVFPNTKERLPARLIRVSDKADAALIKLDIPTDMQVIDMHDNYSTISAGDPVVVMGYPAVSQFDTKVLTRTTDMLSGGDDATTIPEPTVTSGGVARVYRAQARPQDEFYRLFDTPDLYQLTINATGQGNSGGPVFDEYGRVIAIYTYGWEGGGAAVSGAVPIKYGMELLQVRRVVQ